MKILQYHPQWKKAWDEMVATGSNSALIHFRDYMEYHSDRFQDHSLLCFQEGILLAILPASRSGSQLHSHPGLTFGGWIYKNTLQEDQVAQLDNLLIKYCLAAGFDTLVYKEIPSFFYSNPKQIAGLFSRFSDAPVHGYLEKNFYALPLPARIRDRGKRWGAKKAKAHGLSVQKSEDWKVFWERILIPNLQQRHGAHPVHSLAEITSLAEKFPHSIQLWRVDQEDQILGGAVLLLHHHTIHCQYLSASPEGRRLRALDLLITTLIKEFEDFSFFSLGTAISPSSGAEDPGLVSWKKSWGARAYSARVWLMDIDYSI